MASAMMFVTVRGESFPLRAGPTHRVRAESLLGAYFKTMGDHDLGLNWARFEPVSTSCHLRPLRGKSRWCGHAMVKSPWWDGAARQPSIVIAHGLFIDCQYGLPPVIRSSHSIYRRILAND